MTNTLEIRLRNWLDANDGNQTRAYDNGMEVPLNDE